MAPRIIKKREIFFFTFVIFIFTIVSVKYYDSGLYREAERQASPFFSYLRYVARASFLDTDTAQASAGHAKSVPVLLYHGISENSYKNDVLLANFEDQMFALKKAGWDTVTMQDFYSYMKGEKQLPEKSFLLTFDDGIKSSYYNTDPIFHALGYNAVMFAISKYATGEGTSYYLSKNEFFEMIESGRWEIESHGHNAHAPETISSIGEKGHFYSDKLYLTPENIFGGGGEHLETTLEYRKRISDDLRTAKNLLESTFPVAITALAFPFGDYGQKETNFPEAQEILLSEVKKFYDLAFYQVFPRLGYTQNYSDSFNVSENFFITRIEVKPEMTGAELVSYLENGHAKELPFTDSFDSNRGWLDMWGSFQIENGVTTLSGNKESSASITFLDGAALWKNYQLESTVQWIRGKEIELAVRFQDGYNYLSCSFDKDGSVGIEKISERIDSVLAKTRISGIGPKNTRQKFGVRVNGNTLSCLWNGDIVLEKTLSEEFVRGGIAFRTWSPLDKNDALIRIEQITVNKI